MRIIHEIIMSVVHGVNHQLLKLKLQWYRLVHNKNVMGRRQGVWMTTYLNDPNNLPAGSIVRSNYDLGKLHGLRTVWENGKLVLMQVYRKGELHGTQVEFDKDRVTKIHYEDGRQIWKKTFYKGLQQGQAVFYNTDGTREEIEYCLGVEGHRQTVS